MALLEGMFAHAPVAYQIYRPDGHSLIVNEAFRRLFGPEPPPEYNVPEDEVADANGQALDLGSPIAGGGQVTKDFTLSGAALRASGPVKVTVRAADGPAGQAFNLGPPGGGLGVLDCGAPMSSGGLGVLSCGAPMSSGGLGSGVDVGHR